METLRQYKSLQLLLLIIIFMLLYHLVPHTEGSWLWRLPPLLKELPLGINNSVDYIMYDWMPVQVWDPDLEEFEDKPLMRQVTRFISDKVRFLIELVRELLLGGQKTIVYFTGCAGQPCHGQWWLAVQLFLVTL